MINATSKAAKRPEVAIREKERGSNDNVSPIDDIESGEKAKDNGASNCPKQKRTDRKDPESKKVPTASKDNATEGQNKKIRGQKQPEKDLKVMTDLM